MRSHYEDDLQMLCVRWFGYQHNKLAPLLHHSPNGGFRNRKEAARFVGMGTRAGFPDLILLYPSKGYHYLALELKVGKNKQTPLQIEYQRYIEEYGGKYVVIRSIEEFVRTIEDYLS